MFAYQEFLFFVLLPILLQYMLQIVNLFGICFRGVCFGALLKSNKYF